ncbi:MAG: hypothetical protein L6R36_000531 [Xanthoria steineri]|nr:MAG: hypothetical protein L6R36_000531 [Xanthoria steineri]
MSSSDLSDISSPLSTDQDVGSTPPKGKNLDHYFKSTLATKPSPPPKKKRPPSPPHEYVLADNPDIAFICMFRSRFTDAFAKSLPHYGPQDIEAGVAETLPGEQAEKLLCALLGLVLNRKKDIERGHHGRALEEAVQSHTSQWPTKWMGKNPLHGGGNFHNMSPEGRLTLLRALVMWSLGSSEAVQNIIKEKYKQQRHDDDKNQPLSVQSWGRDGDKRRYWLIEGLDDTNFRLYRESNIALKNVTWRSIAGSIDELRQVATKLDDEGSQAARKLRDSIQAAIPRFEAGEDKRKRREYRMSRKAQFTRPDPGFSLYEGRTRGKRIKYTYSDEEDGGSDALSTRRSNRQSGVSTPAEVARPTVTASGRQVKSRYGGAYGETILSGQHENGRALSVGGGDGTADVEESLNASVRGGRVTRRRSKRRAGSQINDDISSEEMDDGSDPTDSGHEWDDDADDHADDEVEDEEMNDDISEDELAIDDITSQPRSLVVSLRYSSTTPNAVQTAPKTPDVIPGLNSVSDQAPPPEANPFAEPSVTKANLTNGFTSSASDTAALHPQIEVQRPSQLYPPQPHEKI